MNKNRYILLSATLTFFSTFLVGNNTINSSMAKSVSDRSNPSLLKEEPKQESKTILPPEVKSAVLEAASQQTSRTVSYLKILNSQPKSWNDGCLGLTEPGKVCVQNVVSGWQVEVTDGVRNWTYRTDNSADLFKLIPSE